MLEFHNALLLILELDKLGAGQRLSYLEKYWENKYVALFASLVLIKENLNAKDVIFNNTITDTDVDDQLSYWYYSSRSASVWDTLPTNVQQFIHLSQVKWGFRTESLSCSLGANYIAPEDFFEGEFEEREVCPICTRISHSLCKSCKDALHSLEVGMSEPCFMVDLKNPPFSNFSFVGEVQNFETTLINYAVTQHGNFAKFTLKGGHIQLPLPFPEYMGTQPLRYGESLKCF